jgi:hypothetical protein
MAKKNRIVAIIEGGVLQSLFTNNADTEILVIDYDTDGADDKDIYQIRCELGYNKPKGKKEPTDTAFVYRTNGYQDTPYVDGRFDELDQLDKERGKE